MTVPSGAQRTARCPLLSDENPTTVPALVIPVASLRVSPAAVPRSVTFPSAPQRTAWEVPPVVDQPTATPLSLIAAAPGVR